MGQFDSPFRPRFNGASALRPEGRRRAPQFPLGRRGSTRERAGVKCSLSRIAAGCAKTTPINHGKAKMPAPVVVRVRPVRDVTCRKRAKRPDCLKTSRPNSTKRAGVISNRDWKGPFDDPIPLPRGRQLLTLEDAGTYITKLPKVEHQAAEWQAAMEALITRRPDDVWAHRCHASVEPTRRAGVQLQPQRHALGKAEAEAGRVKKPKPGPSAKIVTWIRRPSQSLRPANWQGSCATHTKAAGLCQSGAFGVHGMKHQRQFGSASDVTLREVTRISALISDIDRAVRNLDIDIASEEERAGLSDRADPAYPILARMLTARRDNLKQTISALEKVASRSLSLTA
jgi:hypothetical protein